MIDDVGNLLQVPLLLPFVRSARCTSHWEIIRGRGLSSGHWCLNRPWDMWANASGVRIYVKNMMNKNVEKWSKAHLKGNLTALNELRYNGMNGITQS